MATRDDSPRRPSSENTVADLSDEQIEALLARASARLQQRSKITFEERDTSVSFSFPKLDTAKLDKPYISTGDGIAHIDSARLLEGKQRQQANSTREVEDSATAKQLALEVRIRSFSSCYCYYYCL